MNSNNVEAFAALALDLDVVAVDGENPHRGKEREEVRRPIVPSIPDTQSWQYRRRTKQGDPDRKPWLIDVDKRSDDEQRDRGERHDPEASTQHATLVKGTNKAGDPRGA
jgi:hypothetical protein